MSDNLYISDFSKPIYLHHSFQKFWEIQLNTMTYQATIRCGKLFENGSEDALTLQKVEKDHKSWSDATVYAEKHVKMKIDKGYEFLDKNLGGNSAIKFSLSPPSHDLSSLLVSSPPRNENGLKRRGDDSILDQRNDIKQMRKTESNATMEEEKQLQNLMQSVKEQEEFEAKQHEYGEFAQSAYRIPDLRDSEKPKLEKKAAELELFIDFAGTKISVTGYKKKIDTYVVFLKQFLKERKNEEPETSTRREIPISEGTAKYATYIEDKGLDLELICEVHEKSVIVQGPLDKIGELEKFIKEKEKESMTKSPSKAMENTSIEMKIPLSSAMKKARAEIEKKGDHLGVFSEFTEDKLLMLGTSESINQLMAYILEIKDVPEQAQPQKENEGEYTQKEVKITKQINELMAEIKKKAESLELILDMDSEKLLITGFEKRIQQVMKFIEEKEKELEKKAESNPPSASGTVVAKIGEKGDYVQKEISISTFHRACQEDIEKKAKELDLITDFGYDVILVTGFQGNIGLLIAYLYEVESKQKKSLYPKYWDFHEINAFSMVTISPDSQEYKEIEKLFFATMQGQRFIKLERIQNKYLMDHYTTNIQKRMELRPNENINRMLLFHGTRNTKPEIIYKNFDVGFDLQYAAPGMYGKGLYFAVGANYSHGGFVHKTSKGTCQLLIADVFVGKSKNSGGGSFIKAPDGYDSISANGGFYIIYNNFHSYPLYLLEYK